MALKFSLKASDVVTTIEAYRLFSLRYDFPLHVGVTEAGTIFSGTIKSSVGIGVLLAEGIGDTLRVSLTGPPEEEVRVGWGILKSLGLRHRGPEFISCPTCGRVSIDIVAIATEVERRLSHLAVPLKVAVMGCAVNGPGEAREADVGVAGGKGEGLIFAKGRIVKKVKESEIAAEVVRIAVRLAAEKRRGE
jgi:(E)-4-hydroxy-3-methylbut-2-enyl-diphosphate synthase